MNGLAAGFARVNITPAMGTPIAGYYKVRLAEQVLDELEANALALSLGETTVLLISVDHLGLRQCYLDPLRLRMAEITGIPAEHILITATHTHTGPMIFGEVDPALQAEYAHFLEGRLLDAARFAINDLRPARMGWGTAKAPGIAFIRRFRMKDGSIRTNPGINNPDVIGPAGEIDDSVGVVRFDREGAETIVLAHFGVHPDTIGGNVISADWPGMARRTVEKAIDNTRCIVLNGVQGDINHVNPAPTLGALNDMTMDFDNVMRGYGHARHMGRVVAGAVMQAYDKVCYVPVEHLGGVQRIIRHPSNMPTAEEMPLAHHYNDLHQAGRDDEIPFEGMMLTTVVAEAERMVELEHGPEAFDLCVTALAIGNVALVGIPGEPFSGIGRGLKMNPDWSLVLPCCCGNGYEGYFPTADAFTNGSYEVRSSIFKAGVAEAIIDTGSALLGELQHDRRN